MGGVRSENASAYFSSDHPSGTIESKQKGIVGRATHFCMSLKDSFERKYFDLASQADWPRKATEIGNRA